RSNDPRDGPSRRLLTRVGWCRGKITAHNSAVQHRIAAVLTYELFSSPGTSRHQSTQATDSQNCSIFFLIAASGSRPRPAAWLSSACFSFVVPGIAHVTAGCDTTYFS